MSAKYGEVASKYASRNPVHGSNNDSRWCCEIRQMEAALPAQQQNVWSIVVIAGEENGNMITACKKTSGFFLKLEARPARLCASVALSPPRRKGWAKTANLRLLS
ncbi:hypothetical protein CSOJ01_11691 [Colletotrichum sojae]|uniref:Uncharacterized protein n=1 Tax=Colletotrichum sojae TaxID=2175907 RepID=A0A8H6IXF6_9PEZI|nr:hypothetical protein CSOJ01_11691 [Colletotrichum sojae]